MGQQPNIEHSLGEAPKDEAEPGSPRRWKPSRGAELDSPADVAWGGKFGRPGPGTGFVHKLIGRAEFDRSDRPKMTEAVAATVAGARASLFGRSPTSKDVEVALILMGLRSEGLSQDKLAALAERRVAGFDHAAHEIRKGASFLEHIPEAHLAATPDKLRAMLVTQAI